MLVEGVSFGKQLILLLGPEGPRRAPFEESWLLDSATVAQEQATNPTRAGCRSNSSQWDSPQRYQSLTEPLFCESQRVASHAEQSRQEAEAYREMSREKAGSRSPRAEQDCRSKGGGRGGFAVWCWSPKIRGGGCQGPSGNAPSIRTAVISKDL